MPKKILLSGAFFCLMSVLIGAFGAHALEQILETNGRGGTFEIGVRYQMFHALGLLILGTLSIKKPNKLIAYSAILFVSGIFVFSGSLYILSIYNLSFLGAITPIGGLCFILGWITLIIHLYKTVY
ncbi:MAG: DUF423 domain-containing protein [Cyclobacteriaceae bacterium]